MIQTLAHSSNEKTRADQKIYEPDLYLFFFMIEVYFFIYV